MATTNNNALDLPIFNDNEDVWEIGSPDMSSTDDTSSDSFDQDVIESCLSDPHIKEHFMDINYIGAGGYGTVYEARHRKDNRKYALKFVLIDFTNFEKREVEVLASLDHANVLKYHTSWITHLPKPLSYSKTFEEEEKGEEDSDYGVSFEKEEDSLSKNNNAIGGCSKSASTSGKSLEEKYNACLVILTELCSPGKTIKHLLNVEIYLKWMNEIGRSYFWILYLVYSTYLTMTSCIGI